MKWKIGYSREAEKFINKQDIREKGEGEKCAKEIFAGNERRKRKSRLNKVIG